MLPNLGPQLREILARVAVFDLFLGDLLQPVLGARQEATAEVRLQRLDVLAQQRVVGRLVVQDETVAVVLLQQHVLKTCGSSSTAINVNPALAINVE